MHRGVACDNRFDVDPSSACRLSPQKGRAVFPAGSTPGQVTLPCNRLRTSARGARQRCQAGRQRVVWSVLAVGWWVSVAVAQTDPPKTNPLSPTQTQDVGNSGKAAAGSGASATEKGPVPVVSEAERISSLQRSIETDEQRIKDLQRDLDNPNSPYVQAEAAFKTVGDQLEDLRKQAKQAETDGNADLLKELNAKLPLVEKTWEEAKRRFELEIEGRRTRRASLESLTTRLTANRELLEKLRNPESPTAQPKPTTPLDASSPTTPPPSTASPAGPMPAAGEAPPAAPTIDPVTGLPGPATAPPAAEPPPVPEEEKDEQVLLARSAVEERRRELQQAQAELDGITQRIESLQQNIQLERRLRDLSRQKALDAAATAQRLRRDYWRQLSAGEPATETGVELEDAQTRQQSADEEARAASNHLDELQSALAMVHAEQVVAVREVEQKRRELEQAEQALQVATSPWSLRRIQAWVLNQGSKMVGAIVIAALAIWIARAMRTRITTWLVNRGKAGTKEERENRARTLVSVFHNAFVTFVYGFVVVVVLEELGYSVAPLLGGAAVLGLAVAFGAQSLIKDYFTGFIVLLEQQYMLNDVVRLGGVSGQVERITLRMTVLRDIEGHVHFIPHGQITTVTNMTHGWSRALFEITISYGSDIDRATRILMELARDLRRDPAYAALIIEEPAMLGVDKLGDHGVLIKFYIATRPLQQWTVKRELLRRIKLRFDEEGIVIPYPQLSLHTVRDAPPQVPVRPENPLLS